MRYLPRAAAYDHIPVGLSGAVIGGTATLACAYFVRLQRKNEQVLQDIYEDDLIASWSQPSPGMHAAANAIQSAFRCALEVLDLTHQLMFEVLCSCRIGTSVATRLHVDKCNSRNIPGRSSDIAHSYRLIRRCFLLLQCCIRTHLAVTRTIRAREFDAWENQCLKRRWAIYALVYSTLWLAIMCLAYTNLVFAATFDR